MYTHHAGSQKSILQGGDIDWVLKKVLDQYSKSESEYKNAVWLHIQVPYSGMYAFVMCKRIESYRVVTCLKCFIRSTFQTADTFK